jgi:hypothetical protein
MSTQRRELFLLTLTIAAGAATAAPLPKSHGGVFVPLTTETLTGGEIHSERMDRLFLEAGHTTRETTERIAAPHLRGERFEFGLFSGPASVVSTLTKDPIWTAHSMGSSSPDSHPVWSFAGTPSAPRGEPVSVPEPDGLLLAATGLAATLGFGLIQARRRRED